MVGWDIWSLDHFFLKIRKDSRDQCWQSKVGVSKIISILHLKVKRKGGRASFGKQRKKITQVRIFQRKILKNSISAPI